MLRREEGLLWRQERVLRREEGLLWRQERMLRREEGLLRRQERVLRRKAKTEVRRRLPIGMSTVVKDGMIRFHRQPVGRLRSMAAAGDQVLESMRVLGRTGDSIVGEMLKSRRGFKVWDHYPENDVIDPNTHGQYYYHAHPKAQRPGEHGHFHVFIREEGIRGTIKPARIGIKNAFRDFDNPMCHLVAISMNAQSMPVGLFMTNRWVTNDPWFTAQDTISVLDQFEIDTAHPSWPVNQWITGMLRLFRPQIAALLHDRDKVMDHALASRPQRSPFLDDTIEIVSACRISLRSQIRAINRALASSSRRKDKLA